MAYTLPTLFLGVLPGGVAVIVLFYLQTVNRKAMTCDLCRSPMSERTNNLALAGKVLGKLAGNLVGEQFGHAVGEHGAKLVGKAVSHGLRTSVGSLEDEAVRGEPTYLECAGCGGVARDTRVGCGAYLFGGVLLPLGVAGLGYLVLSEL